jgi:hypothetical protein
MPRDEGPVQMVVDFAHQRFDRYVFRGGRRLFLPGIVISVHGRLGRIFAGWQWGSRHLYVSADEERGYLLAWDLHVGRVECTGVDDRLPQSFRNSRGHSRAARRIFHRLRFCAANGRVAHQGVHETSRRDRAPYRAACKRRRVIERGSGRPLPIRP